MTTIAGPETHFRKRSETLPTPFPETFGNPETSGNAISKPLIPLGLAFPTLPETTTPKSLISLRCRFPFPLEKEDLLGSPLSLSPERTNQGQEMGTNQMEPQP